MGCDISMFLEYSENKEFWNTFADSIHLGRNYRMFGYLTNGSVRYDLDLPLNVGIDTRGTPSNLSYTVSEELEKWKNEVHNVSWLNYKEYKRIIKEALKNEKEDDERVPDEYLLLLEMMKFLKKRGYSVRIVFFFDS